jgi:pimeloyl-ACP methyl ester carboxylesterase
VWSQRREVSIPSGTAECAAWFSVPDGAGRFGCVVMGHGFSLTRHDSLEWYADAFASAGLAVLVFDYRHFGDSSGQPRQRFRRRRQILDFHNAISFAREQPGVDPARIVAWGFSFGGAHALEMGIADASLAGIIALCPFVDGLRRVRATRPGLAAWMIPRGIVDQIGRHTLIPVTAPPGERAAMTLPGEAEGFAATVAEGSPWQNLISPAIFLTVGLYRPFVRAGELPMPLWVGMGEEDITTAGSSIQRLAESAPHGELHRYPVDHFGPFQPEHARQIADDQLKFLRRTNVLTQKSAAQIQTHRATGD